MKLSSKLASIAGALGIMAGCNSTNASSDTTTPVSVVSPQEFQRLLSADTSAILIDARRPDEYSEGHLANAILLNWLDRPSFDKGAQALDSTKHVFIYCRSGRRSNDAAQSLAQKGFKVTDMQGGIMAWESQGLSVVK